MKGEPMTAFRKMIAMLLLGIVIFSPISSAEMISGKVVSFDASTRKLTLSTVHPSGESVNSDIWINPGASLQGLSSLEEIKRGDTLWVETETDSEGNLRTGKIARG